MPDTTEHPLLDTLAAYRERRLPPAETLAVSDHLAACDACRSALAGPDRRALLPPADALAYTVPPVDEPATYGELAELLDGQLDNAQTADLHARLAESPFLAAELADLEAFRLETAALPPKVHEPPAPASIPAKGKIIAFPGRPWRAALAAAAAVVLFAAAGWWALHGPQTGPVPGLLSAANPDLSSLPPELRRDVTTAAATGIIPPAPLPPALRPAAGTLAGETAAPAGFKQLSPVGVVVRESAPRLRWTPRRGAAAYSVYVAPADGSDALQTVTLPGTRIDWTPSPPLARGTLYEWQIEAKDKAGNVIDRAPVPPSPESRFLVLDARSADTLANVDAHFASEPLVRGTAYLRAGLKTEAAEQFARLVREHPDSAVAKKLVQAAAQP